MTATILQIFINIVSWRIEEQIEKAKGSVVSNKVERKLPDRLL